jgi:hypothetical protein
MTAPVPRIVEDALGGDDALARVSLGGGDELFVAADRTLAFRAGGVLSDETVEEYPHGVDRLTVSEGRRKARITFEYPVEPPRELALPEGDLDEALQPVLASVLRASGATDPDERFHRAFRLSELTLVVTSDRLFKHVGSALWDAEYDDYRFADVAGVDYERGDVATGIVLTVDGRKERVKTPNDRLPEVRRALEEALLAYHDVDAVEELGDHGGDGTGDGEADAGADADGNGSDPVAGFGGVDPIDAGSHPGIVEGDETDRPEGSPGTGDRATATGDDGGVSDAADDADARDGGSVDDGNDDRDEPGSDGGVAASAPADEAGGGDAAATPFTQDIEPSGEDRLPEELEELRAAVERNNELLRRQGAAIERLVEELRSE